MFCCEFLSWCCTARKVVQASTVAARGSHLLKLDQRICRPRLRTFPSQLECRCCSSQVVDNGVERRPAAEQNPDHAGEQYRSLAITVDLNTSCIDDAGKPWLRSTRRAYSSREHVVSRPLTWSDACFCCLSKPCQLCAPAVCILQSN